MAKRAARGFGQYNGVARAIERVGERWALLIVRDLLAGPRRYSDLKAGLPRIPTNILSDRLKELQETGIIRRVPTVRGGYQLTPQGRALEPIIVELERWGWAMLGEPGEEEIVTCDALAMSLRTAFRSDSTAGAPPTEYVVHVGDDVSVAARVAGGRVDVVPIGPAAIPQPRGLAAVAVEATVEFAVTPTEFRDLLSGALDPSAVRLITGERETLEGFVRTFRIDEVVRNSTSTA